MEPVSRSDTSILLARWSEGDDEALERLIPLVYGELERLAHRYLTRERSDHTLETSALVHEAYLKLLRHDNVRCEHRAHFFGIAARTMRRILVDHARSRSYAKRGGGARRIPLDEQLLPAVWPDEGLVELDEALVQLAEVSPQQVRVVELRYFAGLTAEEIASLLGLSVPTVTRRWRVAKAWLFRYMKGPKSDG